MIIDAGVHLWRPETPERPWPAARRDLERQRETALEPAEMLDLMDDSGVDRAVIVPPIWVGDGNDDALEWAATYPERFAVVGRFELSRDNEPQLRRWLATPGMLGIRLSYPGPSTWLDARRSDWLWSAAQQAHIPLIVLCQGQAAAVRPIAERYPDLVLIIDHLGLRNVRKQRAAGLADNPFDTFGDFLQLAQYPNVSGKFSSLPYYSTDPYPYPDLAPYLREAYETFGPQRLLWASDISRMSLLAQPPTYRQTLDHLRTLGFLSDDDLTWVLGRTAARVLNWPTEVA